MPRKVGVSGKAERDQLRDRMRSLGCSVAQIAAEMSRRFNLRPRAAWRHALGWPQWKLAQEYNTAHPGAKLADNRISEYESWPHGGTPPSVHYLANLAATFGHGCSPAQLVDADDMEHLSPADRRLLTPAPTGSTLMVTTASTPMDPTMVLVPSSNTHPARQFTSQGIDTVGSPGDRRIVRCDARGPPIREEVVMAAEESAEFRRWSATTNVDDDVLEQMEADVAEIALRYLIDPPATVFSRLIGARNDVFTLIAGRQDSAGVSRALAVAASAPTDPTADEPGVFAFATGKAAYYASEAHRELGGARHLNAAVDWAVTAVEEFTAERRPNTQFIAAARIDLARAHLAHGDLDAVGEHLAPVLTGTVVEQRTVPIISRATSLNTLLRGHPNVASSTVTALQDDLAEFCATPATSPELEQGSTD